MRHSDLLFHSILEHAYDFKKKEKKKKNSKKHRLVDRSTAKAAALIILKILDNGKVFFFFFLWKKRRTMGQKGRRKQGPCCFLNGLRNGHVWLWLQALSCELCLFLSWASSPLPWSLESVRRESGSLSKASIKHLM